MSKHRTCFQIFVVSPLFNGHRFGGINCFIEAQPFSIWQLPDIGGGKMETRRGGDLKDWTGGSKRCKRFRILSNLSILTVDSFCQIYFIFLKHRVLIAIIYEVSWGTKYWAFLCENESGDMLRLLQRFLGVISFSGLDVHKFLVTSLGGKKASRFRPGPGFSVW